jgi:hypothetical protein
MRSYHPTTLPPYHPTALPPYRLTARADVCGVGYRRAGGGRAASVALALQQQDGKPLVVVGVH